MKFPVPSDFQCLHCGNCCTIEGAVTVSDAEIGKIAAHLGISDREFADSYTELKASRTGLKLKDAEDGSCIFLDDDRHCRVNAVKPEQCRGFPHNWNYMDWTKVCAFHYRTPEPQKDTNET